jgi:hypothetical protein
VCKDIADSVDSGDSIDAIIIDFPKAIDLVPHGRLLTKIANSWMVSRVGVWIIEFLFVRMQRVGIGEYLSEEVRMTSGVPQRSVLSPLLFLAHVIDISRNIVSTIRLFSDDSNIQKNYK